MHATCEFNNMATTANTATTTTTGAAAVDLNNSQEQILIHSIEPHKNIGNSHNHIINTAEQNGHTKSGSSDDLFMSASSSTTDFNCGKITTPTSTIHLLNDFLPIIPSTPKKSKLIKDSLHDKIDMTDNICELSKIALPGIVGENTTVTSELVTATTPIKSFNSLNTSNHSISTPVRRNVDSSTSSVIKTNSLISQAPTLKSTTTTTSPITTTATSLSSNVTSEKSSETSSSLFQRIEYEDLLQWNDMPRHLQFNPYVLTGYRPLSSVKGCFFSLFYWHNETINILTHGIPIVYILATVPSLMPWEKEFQFLSFCHIFGAVAPWCGSFIYHLFMNLERGENIYYRLLKIDMVGIWISQSFGALPMVTASVYCFGYKMKWLMIIGYCILSLWGLYKALNASSPWQRRLCFALPFTMRVFLTLFRTLRWVGGNPLALTHVYLQDLVSVFGGAIGAMHIPEKWFPGHFDLYLNSHNIMHVLVVVAVYSMHKATISDFEWMSNIECSTFYNTNTTVYSPMDNHFEL